eukprot:1781384-Heterocapsa_arctica.AAC.1
MAKHKAEHAAEWKRDEALFTGKVFTDGSAINPELPWLRRASWAIAWRGADCSWRYVNGQTPGMQTVARSERYAAVWAAEHGVPGFQIVSDCTYV